MRSASSGPRRSATPVLNPARNSLSMKRGRRPPLHLVEDGVRGQVAHEPDRIGPRRGGDRLVVERDVAIASWLPDEPRQRRLAALTRAMNEHRRAVGQRPTQARHEVTREPRGGLGHGGGYRCASAECTSRRRLNAGHMVGRTLVQRAAVRWFTVRPVGGPGVVVNSAPARSSPPARAMSAVLAPSHRSTATPDTAHPRRTSTRRPCNHACLQSRLHVCTILSTMAMPDPTG